MSKLEKLILSAHQATLIMTDRCSMYSLVSKEKTETHRDYFVERIIIRKKDNKELYSSIISKLKNVDRFNGIQTVTFIPYTLPQRKSKKKKK